ncbi:MAG TPA: hypothetical protein VFE03_03415 [Caulobacteraceae bacterium]|nr:hypothetical protein [Caulobacteraceae bacterium]
MTRTILIIVLAVGLAGCSFIKERFAFLRRAPADRTQVVNAPAFQAAPQPAEGLWAILDPGCPKPNAVNFKSWPRCASPFWISRDTAVVVRSLPGARKGPTPDQSYRADYRLAAGDPLIAQVGTQKDGYLFLALTELTRDDHGRLVAASGAAFVCAKAAEGPMALKPNANGCDSESPDGVRRAARETLGDHVALSRVAWIASGAP